MPSTLPSAEECLERIFAGESGELCFSSEHNEPEEIPPLYFELACGHRVILALRECAITDVLDNKNWRTWEFLALRIYVAGDRYDNRLRRYAELREGVDFERTHVMKHWLWLEELTRGVGIWEFEDVEDFLDCLCDYLGKNFSEEDNLEHWQRLPGLCIPSLFDQWDDSLSTESGMEGL